MKTDQLIDLLGADNRVARNEAHRRRLTMVAVLISVVWVAAVAFIVLAGVRPDVLQASILEATMRKETVAFTATLAGLMLAWRLSRPDAGSAPWWLLPAAVVAALVIWEIATTGVAGWQARLLGTNGFACLGMIPVLGLLPFAALMMAMRQRAPAHPGRAGAAAGLAAAGIGAAIYALHCTDDSMFFVAFWYGAATLVLGTAGALAGPRLLRW